MAGRGTVPIDGRIRKGRARSGRTSRSRIADAFTTTNSVNIAKFETCATKPMSPLRANTTDTALTDTIATAGVPRDAQTVPNTLANFDLKISLVGNRAEAGDDGPEP